MEYLDKEGLIKVWDKTIKQLDRKANKVHKHTTEDINGLQDYAKEDDIVTYTLSKSGSTITLTGSDGSETSVTDSTGGDGITYTLEKSGTTISLKGSDGSVTSVTDSISDDNGGEPNQNAFSNVTVQNSSGTTKFSETADSETDTLYIREGENVSITDGGEDAIVISATDTTYALTKSGNTIKLVGSDGSETSVTDNVGGDGITYTLSKSGTTISLTGSDGSVTSVTDSVGQPGDGEPNQNAFSNVTVQNSSGATKFTESADTETDTLIIKEGSNITITDGGDDTLIISATMPVMPSIVVTNNNPTLAWGTQSTVGTVDGTALTVIMPEKPDIEDNNTEYRLEKSGGYIQLINTKDHSVVSQVVDSVGGGPDGNTQYKLAKSGNYIQLLDASDNSVVSQVVDDKGNGEANVQSDWNVSDTTSPAYIKNKPTSMAPSKHTHTNISSSEKFELEVELTDSERHKQVSLTNDPSFNGIVSDVAIKTYATQILVDSFTFESDSYNLHFNTYQSKVLLSYDLLAITDDYDLDYIEFYYSDGSRENEQIPYNSETKSWEFHDGSLIPKAGIQFTSDGLEILVNGFDIVQGDPIKFYIWVGFSGSYTETTEVSDAVTWNQSSNDINISVRDDFDIYNIYDYLTANITYNLNIGSDLNSDNVYAYFNSLALTNIMPVSGDNIKPSNDNKYNFGTSDKRWKQIYAANSAISTSDRNEKTDIEALDDRYSRLFDNLNPIKYRFKENESNRIHTGLIAQDVEEALTSTGLTSKDFAGLCYWDKEDGTKGYGLRYEEFIALNIAETQKLKKENEELKARLANIEAKLANL